MRHRSFRSFALITLSALSIAAASPLFAATPQLDGLAREVAEYVNGGVRDGQASLRLSTRIASTERIARSEADETKRAELLAWLAGLRQDLSDFSPRAGADGGGDKANGVFTGRVSDDGAPLAQIEVRAYSPGGGYYSSAVTGADGRYSLSLAPGTFVLYVDPYSARFSPQLYDGLNCRLYDTCQPSDGDPLALPSGGQVTADFALADLAAISGEVRRADTGEPVETFVKVFRATGAYIGSTPVAADGSYFFGGLDPGRYYVVAARHQELAGMIYDGAPCNIEVYDLDFTCSREAATIVDLALEQVAAGIDFALVRGATFEFRVTAADSGALLTSVQAQVLTPEFAGVAEDFEIEDGLFRVDGVAPGRYYLGVVAPTYTHQVFDRRNCEIGPHCFAGAQAIDAASGATYRADFPLVRRGSLTGRVTDERSGATLASADVEVWDRETGRVHAVTLSDSAGFFSFSNLPAIDMLISARHPEYRGEFFDDVDERLGPGAAKPVKILPGEVVGGIEMKLSRRGGIAAHLVAAESGTAIGCESYAVPAANLAAPVQPHYCGEDGVVRFNGLLPGFYYVFAGSYQRALYLYGKGSCNLFADTGRCDPREGTAVEVKSGEVTQLGDLRLERSGRLETTVRFETLPNGPVVRGVARLFENDGTELPSIPLFADGAWAVYNGLAPGTYRLVVEGSPSWQSVAYPAVSCGRWYCDPLLSEQIVVAAGAEVELADVHLARIPLYEGCVPSETSLCLNQNRYRVSAAWRDFLGATGNATARPLTADSGYFYFFSPGNLEVLVKLLDGCDRRLGHHFWFYAAGLTNVQVELTVEDTLTGTVERYSNPLGSPFQPILDNTAFATCDATGGRDSATASASSPAELAAPPADAAPAAGSPVTGAPVNCDLPNCLGDRFEVNAYFRTASGFEGAAYMSRVTPDTATFTFFDANNVELVVKVLEACSTELPGYWVFASGLTDVAVELIIRDRETGRIKIYRQPLGPYAPVIDLGSFPCD